eukprot:m.446747 g.446747  ORF g.446747 m.446747 type:complete len:258 (+) comp56873_c0_seq1:322-1095(+)
MLQTMAHHLLQGLGYLHGKSLVHSDLCPKHILVDAATSSVKICSLAAAVRPGSGTAERQEMVLLSPPRYRAPELSFSGADITFAADMWSLGCILVEMLSLEPVFTTESVEEQRDEVMRMISSSPRVFDQFCEEINVPLSGHSGRQSPTLYSKEDSELHRSFSVRSAHSGPQSAWATERPFSCHSPVAHCALPFVAHSVRCDLRRRAAGASDAAAVTQAPDHGQHCTERNLARSWIRFALCLQNQRADTPAWLHLVRI